MAIAGLIIGIVALVGCIVGTWVIPGIGSIVALALSILGMILSIVAKKKGGSGAAKAGVVIGIIATVLNAISFFTCGLCAICILCGIGEAAGAVAGAI